MATSVTFICLKNPYQKFQVFDVIFSKGGARKNRLMENQIKGWLAGAGEAEVEAGGLVTSISYKCPITGVALHV